MLERVPCGSTEYTVRKWSPGELTAQTDLDQKEGHGEALRNVSEVEMFGSAFGWV